jgi:mRNA interferase RelE/StbE
MPNSYVLDLTNKARKSLEGLENKQCKQVALKMLSLLRDPFPNDSEKLTGSNYRRVDIGEYRIVYDVKDNVVQVLVIGPRNDGTVYKRF